MVVKFSLLTECFLTCEQLGHWSPPGCPSPGTPSCPDAGIWFFLNLVSFFRKKSLQPLVVISPRAPGKKAICTLFFNLAAKCMRLHGVNLVWSAERQPPRRKSYQFQRISSYCLGKKPVENAWKSWGHMVSLHSHLLRVDKSNRGWAERNHMYLKNKVKIWISHDSFFIRWHVPLQVTAHQWAGARQKRSTSFKSNICHACEKLIASFA